MRPTRTTSSSTARTPSTPIHVWTHWPIRGARRPGAREVATAVLMRTDSVCPFATEAHSHGSGRAAPANMPHIVRHARARTRRAHAGRDRSTSEGAYTSEADLRRITVGEPRRHD